MDELVGQHAGGHVGFPGVAAPFRRLHPFEEGDDGADPEAAGQPRQQAGSAGRPERGLLFVVSVDAEFGQLLLPVPGVTLLGGGQFEQDRPVFPLRSFRQSAVENDVVEFLLDIPPVPPRRSGQVQLPRGSQWPGPKWAI